MKKLFVLSVLLMYLINTQIEEILAQNTEFLLGDKKIIIPYPEGFQEINENYPEVLKDAQNFVTEQNKLLVLFLSEDDLERIMKNEISLYQRYIMIEVYRNIELNNISELDFQDAISDLKTKQDQLVQNMDDLTESEFEKLEERLSAKSDQKVDYSIEEPINLGTFYDTTNIYSFGFLGNLKFAVGDQTVVSKMVTVANFIRANNRLIFVFVYSIYNTYEDIVWARNFSKSWINEIVELNPSTNANSERFELDDIVSKAIAVAIIVFIIGVISNYRKRARKYKN